MAVAVGDVARAVPLNITLPALMLTSWTMPSITAWRDGPPIDVRLAVASA